MLIVRSQAELANFYRSVLSDGSQTAERLCAPVSDRFAGFLNGIGPDVPRTALELGYGMGAYTVALARSGFAVTAVDQVPTQILRARLPESEDWAKRIELLEQRIEHFDTTGHFGIVVAKDVLHYLNQDLVRDLLTRCVQQAPNHVAHFLEVFTDIRRTDSKGCPVLIEGEARYTSAGFRAAIEHLYAGWQLHVTDMPHTERDSGGQRTYFSANKITVCAHRGSVAGTHQRGAGLASPDDTLDIA